MASPAVEPEAQSIQEANEAPVAAVSEIESEAEVRLEVAAEPTPAAEPVFALEVADIHEAPRAEDYAAVEIPSEVIDDAVAIALMPAEIPVDEIDAAVALALAPLEIPVEEIEAAIAQALAPLEIPVAEIDDAVALALMPAEIPVDDVAFAVSLAILSLGPEGTGATDARAPIEIPGDEIEYAVGIALMEAEESAAAGPEVSTLLATDPNQTELPLDAAPASEPPAEEPMILTFVPETALLSAEALPEPNPEELSPPQTELSGDFATEEVVLMSDHDHEKKNQTVSPDETLPPPTLEAAANEWAPDADIAPQAQAQADAEEAANEIAARDELPQAASPAQPSSTGVVTLIENPFNIPTLEIGEEQQQLERDLDQEIDDGLEDAEDDEEAMELASDDAPEAELDEDELALVSPEETEAQFENLAQAMAAEVAKTAEDAVEMTALEAEQSAERLAREIAEDEALQQQMQQEADEMEELDPELQAALPKAPVEGADGELDLAEVESCIEALLFMTDKPMSLEKLRELLGPDFTPAIFQEALTRLRSRYQRPNHGIELAAVAGGYQFRTKPGRAALAKKLAKQQTQRLSGGAMETLAIVAYRQPVLKDEIDKVRGVDSSHFIRGLLDKKLIRISGRSELPGRPMLYSTSQEFLELFGLKDLSAMPSLRELEQMVPASQSGGEEEDPRVKEMRRLVGEMKADNSTSLIYDPREDEKFLKDIRERVNSIPTSTPYIEEQKAQDKARQEAADAQGIPAQPVPGLEGLSPQLEEMPQPPAPPAAEPVEAPVN